MEKTCVCSSILPKLPLPSGRGSSGAAVACGAGRDRRQHLGRRVDEGMIVLRRRVHETRMIERNYEPPADWMDWEKRYYTCYDDYIYTLVGLLQAHLMNSRPSVALGLLALLTMSVPASTVLILWRLVEIGSGALSAVDLLIRS